MLFGGQRMLYMDIRYTYQQETASLFSASRAMSVGSVREIYYAIVRKP